MRIFKFWYGAGIGLAVLVVALVAVSQTADQSIESEELQDFQEQFIYDPAKLRDPFVPLIVPTITPTPALVPTPTVKIVLPELIVEVIFWSPNRSMAVINKELKEVGDVILGAKIIEMEYHAVVVVYQGKEFRLELPTD